MKKLLIASTALTAMAGAAFADGHTGVSVSGDGRMGVVNDGSNTQVSSRFRVSFTGTGETDTGLTFGGSIRADNAGDRSTASGTNGAAGTQGNVYIGGSNNTGSWKLSAGDVDSGAAAAVGHLAAVGYSGLGSLNSVQYLDQTNSALQLKFSTSGADIYVSTGNSISGTGVRQYAAGLAYAFDAFKFGVGYEKNGSNNQTSASISADLAGLNLKAIYATKGAGTSAQQGASASYDIDSITATAFYRKNNAGVSNFGVGAAYDLGGGAALKAGFVDAGSTNFFDLGVTFAF